MNPIYVAVRFVRAVQNAWEKRYVFFVVFLVVFFCSLTVLIVLDEVPDDPSATASTTPSVASTIPEAPLSPDVADAFTTGELPVKVEIPSINLTASVADPATTDVDVLDQYLLQGAVRYPTSALLGEKGNVILFGHSSYLPIVNNQAYKTFDGIQKLKPNDTITVYSSDRAYTYAVDSVQQENADEDAIPLSVTNEELTLSTCDSFATKSDRFVVTAHLVESHPIAS